MAIARKSHHLNGRAVVPPAPRLCSSAATALIPNRHPETHRKISLRLRYLTLVASWYLSCSLIHRSYSTSTSWVLSAGGWHLGRVSQTSLAARSVQRTSSLSAELPAAAASTTV